MARKLDFKPMKVLVSLFAVLAILCGQQAVAADPPAGPAEIVLPVTQAKVVDRENTPIAEVLKNVDGIPVVSRGVMVYWRLPQTLQPGEYYPCFQIVRSSGWNNEVWPSAYHNGQFVKTVGMTDPQPLGAESRQAEVCAEQPRQLSPGDVIGARMFYDADGDVLAALVLRRQKPPAVHMKIGTNSWGMYYKQPFKPLAVDTTILTAPDENRSGKASVTVFNYTEKPRPTKISWEVKDFFGEVLATGSEDVQVPSIGIWQKAIDYRVPETSDHLLITIRADDATGTTIHHTADVMANRPAGPRPRLYLSGSWDFAQDESLFLTSPPAADKFIKDGVTVPGYMPYNPRGRGPRHVGWYRKTFVAPDWLKGQRQVLVFGTVAYECDIYLNGEKVAYHFGPKDSFEVDLTGKVTPGANEIIVGVRDWFAAAKPEVLNNIKSTKSWDTTAKNNFEISQFWATDALIAPSWDAPGGIKDDVYMESRPDVHVADVFVKPSIRQKSLTVDVTIANASDKPVEVTPVCTVLDQGRQILRFPGEKISIAPNSQSTVTLLSPAENIPLWWPHDPHLLQCRISLQNGQDVQDVRFGFREVWLGENNFLFNGRKAKMTRAGYNPYAQGHMNRRSLREMATWYPPYGITIVEVCNSIPTAADICDEEGLLWDLETNWLIFGVTTYLLKDDVHWKNAEQLAVRTARTFKNHPCVVHYDHSNEFGCYAGGTNVENAYEVAAKRLFGIYEAVKAFDPTRPGSSDADGDLNGRLPDFNLHYTQIERVPWQIIKDHTFLSPVDAFNSWFENPSPDYVPQKGDIVRITSNGYPFSWAWGTRPVYAPEVLWAPFCFLPHGGTYWRGDSVYRNIYDCYQAEMDRAVSIGAGYRHMDMWMIHPWGGSALTYASMRPDCVVPIESLHNYYDDEQVVRPVNIHHDKLLPAEMTLRWGIISPAGDVEAGREDLAMDAGALLRKKLKFNLPKVDKPTEASLYYRLEDATGVVDSTTQDITVFPREDVKVAQKIRTALWDPAGTSQKTLSKLGVDIVPVANVQEIPAGVGILVVGAEAWTQDNREKTAKPLFDFAAKGGTLLVLHQKYWPDGSPVQLRLDPQQVASRVWKRAASHPVFDGISDSWLHFWRNGHVVSSFDFVKPDSGNSITLADAGVNTGLERSVLLEVRYGAGRVLASQFHLIDSFDAEPVAPRLLANLLTAAAAQLPALHPVAVCAKSDDPVVQMLNVLGADMSLLSRPLDAESLKGHNVILVQLDQDLTPAEAKALGERAADGALVWVRGASPNTLPVLEAITACQWKDTGKPLAPWVARAVIEGAPNELAGLSNGEFYWKRGKFGDGQGLEDPSWKIADIADQYIAPVKAESARNLLYPELMWTLPVGQGRVLVDQVLWAEKVGDVQKQARRIASVLLTNAGVTLK
ncbi:MAG: hypothetical protein HQ546_09355 [Planctomycetes bacterium]|nr:hypothetical protein [Planctomycetota bacterium]